MARKIKFALEMADGAKVRTNIEELREHFDIQSVLGYFVSGKLQEWLADRYYDEEAEKIGELNKEDQELNKKLCSILGVEYMETDKADMETLQRINEKKAILRQVTSDTNVIDNAQWVAFDQEELADLLDEDATTIYLYGDKFNIPIRRKNMTYIGVNNPQISINAKEYKEIEDSNIKLINVTLPEGLREVQASEDKENKEYKSLDFFERIKRKYGDNEAKAEKLYFENKFDEAAQIFEEEAQKGNLRAFYFIAEYYKNGYGEYPIINDKAREIRKKCWSDDDPFLKLQGLYHLSVETGEFENEFIKIKDDLFKEALAGDPFACKDIIDLKRFDYYDVPNDVIAKCKQIALSNKNSAVIVLLAVEAFQNGDFNKAFTYADLASKQGNLLGNALLAGCYEEGIGVEKDVNKAFKLLKVAAEKGCVDAIYRLAVKYTVGRDMVEQDDYEAFKWAEKGAEKNDATCQDMVADCYFLGMGVEKDEVKSFLWFMKAAEQGNSHAQYRVGRFYYCGKAVRDDEMYVTDEKEAFKWFQKAANQGEPDAMYYLGECYYNGEGTYEDLGKARKWYQKAAEKGNEDAMEALERM